MFSQGFRIPKSEKLEEKKIVNCRCSFAVLQLKLFVFLRFFLKDLSSSVRDISEFLNKPLSEEVIQRIAHQCSFEEMAKRPDTFKVFPKLELSYLRKGDVGDWKTHFTPEVNEKFETELLAKTREHGLEFD